MTELEIEFGLLTIPESRRREAVTAAFTQVLDKMIESRVASFDKDAGTHAAKLMAARRRPGRAGDLREHDCRHRDLHGCDARYPSRFSFRLFVDQRDQSVADVRPARFRRGPDGPSGSGLWQ